METLVCDLFLEDAAAVLEEMFKWYTCGEFFYKHLSRRVLAVRIWEPGRGSVTEVLSEDGQVSGLYAHIELESHHLAELLNLVWKAEPLHRGYGIDDVGKEPHDTEVAPDDALDLRMQDLDSHVVGRYSRRCTLQQWINRLVCAFHERLGVLDGVIV